MMYLVLVDAHSRWPEIFCMKTVAATQAVEKVCGLFKKTKLPGQVVTDSSSQLSSDEFQGFMKKNNIGYITSAPCYPVINGLAK